MEFPDIDIIHEMLEEIVEELPVEFFDGLNNGIVLLDEIKLHPKSHKTKELYILGQYERGFMGNGIRIFYGSFKMVYLNLDLGELKEKLRKTLVHEITHHLEYLSGTRDLELEDEEFLRKYKRNIKKSK